MPSEVLIMSRQWAVSMKCQLSMDQNSGGWEIIPTKDHSQVDDSVHGQQRYEAVATNASTYQLLRLIGHQELWRNTGAASWNLILLARPKLPPLRAPTPNRVHWISQKQQVSGRLLRTRASWTAQALDPGIPTFPLTCFLERLPNTITSLHALIWGL